MRRYRKQFVRTLVFTYVVFPVISISLACPSLRAQPQTTSTPIDPDLRAKAAAGDPISQFKLGLLYDNGQGVARSYVQAIDWYSEAAEQGFADAQNNLGNLCTSSASTA